MIEAFDPNLNILPPPQSDAQQVDPIKPESVKIEKQELERKKTGDEEGQGKRRRKRKRKDRVELSNRPDLSDVDNVNKEQSGEVARKRDDKNIDIII